MLDALNLSKKIAQLLSSLRQGQQEMGDWRSGTLAVSAVPGAGKSHGMAVATAIALARKAQQTQLSSQEQIVLVTFTRSAAINLKRKVKDSLSQLDLPNQGYTVQTLHSLALAIAKEHPRQSGIQLDQVTLISPYRGHQLIEETVDTWIQNNRSLYQKLIEYGEFDGEDTNRLQRQSVISSEVLPAIAVVFIQEAKSSGLYPDNIKQAREQDSSSLPLMEIGAGLYETYQSILIENQLIDYEDMILGALKALENKSVRQKWQSKIWAVFEDEAQDSSPLQFRLLEILAADNNGDIQLVRVGDANQAINSSFTAADPKFFRRFCAQQQKQQRLAQMTYAGRSNQLILETANRFLCWVNQNHGPVFITQQIQPVPPKDPQPNANPEVLGKGVEVVFPGNVYQSVEAIALRILQLYKKDETITFAILVRENKQAHFISELLTNPEQYNLDFSLKESGLEIYDVSQNVQMTQIPRQLLTLLQFVSSPHSPQYLKAALELLVQLQLVPPVDVTALTTEPERFLFPSPLEPAQEPPVTLARNFLTKLLKARQELPQFQLLSFISLALKYEAAELATADKLASRIIQQTQGKGNLADTIQALQTLLSSERFEPVAVDPDSQSLCRDRQITILTMHKAKGLDWDAVFIPFLHESIIPGRLGVAAQAKFLGNMSLPDVSRHLVRHWVETQKVLPLETAWERAKALKTAEEYRLLYVAMTRPKRLLWMSAADFAPFWWGGFMWDKPESLQEQAPVEFLPLIASSPENFGG